MQKLATAIAHSGPDVIKRSHGISFIYEINKNPYSIRDHRRKHTFHEDSVYGWTSRGANICDTLGCGRLDRKSRNLYTPPVLTYPRPP